MRFQPPAKRAIRGRIGILLLAFALPVASANADATTMARVYDAIAVLLPLSVHQTDGQAAWDPAIVEPHLTILGDALSTMVAHAAGEIAPSAVVARSYDRLVHDATLSFRQRWPDYAYYSVMELTDHCVACHARLPLDKQARFGPHLVKRMDLDGLAAESKALVYGAISQFTAALDALEKRLLEPELDPSAAHARGIDLRYLRTGLSFSTNTERLQRFIDTYLERGDVPPALAEQWQHWKKTLTRLSGSLATTPNPRRAQKIYDNVSKRWAGPADRLRAADDLIAAHMMRSYLRLNPQQNSAATAELYFKLANIALRTREPTPPLPEMEILLAATINAVPGGARAAEAFAMLERYGAIHDEPLAEQDATRALLDMHTLRKRAAGAK